MAEIVLDVSQTVKAETLKSLANTELLSFLTSAKKLAVITLHYTEIYSQYCNVLVAVLVEVI